MVTSDKNKKEIIMDTILKRIAWLFIIAPAVYLGVIWSSIPDTVPLHANLKGEVDRYGSKNELITLTVILTSVNILLYLLLPQIYRIDPKKYAAENKDRLRRIAFAVCVFLSAVVILIIYSSIHESMNLSIRLILAGSGLLIAIIGNYIHNIKPNYFAGIRLPWTLNNDDNWRKTHLLGGKLMFGGGLLITIICLFVPFNFAMISMFIILCVVLLITCAYSYNLYRKMKEQRQ